MRVAFFVPRCTPDNSHGRYVLELAARFANDHEVTIYTGAMTAGAPPPVDVRVLPVVNRPAIARLAGLWAASATVVAGRRYDVVHVQGADAPVGNVVTAHCCNAALRQELAGGEPRHRRWNRILGAAAERFCFTGPQTRRVIAVSAKVREEIVAHYGVDRGRVEVIHHGVSLEHFSPVRERDARDALRRQLGIDPADFVVVYVGGDYRLKGLLPILEAVTGLPERVRILAVGVRADAALRARIGALGLERRVAIIASAAEIGRCYGASDCFVLPTRYDAFSLTTLEAMAAGLPVIVSRRAGVAELIAQGREGVLLDDPSDVRALRMAIARVLEDVGFRSALVAAGRALAARRTWDEVAEHTLGVYRDAMAGRAA